MIIYVAAFICFLSIYIYQHFRKRNVAISKSKEIPFEKGSPIIGVVNKIKEPLCYYLTKLSKKHGPIYRIKFGMRHIVVLNSFEYIKAALVDNAEAFTGRWKAEKYIFVTNNAGLIFIDGHVWAEQRSFAAKTLREFGVGRSRSVEIVQSESLHLLEALGKKKGQNLNLIYFLSLYTLNVISKFVMNRRFCHGDPEHDTLQKFMSVVVVQNDPVAYFSLMFPFLENHEWLIKFIMWVTSRKSLADGFHRLIEKEIKAHLNKLNLKSEGDDFIDKFLMKQLQMRKETGSVETFTDWQLMRNVFDLLIGGIGTSSVTLTWCFMFMAMYPEVQERVHKEIVDKIGKERMPTMGDKMSLTYTQAVMDETFRLASIVPLSLMHRALTEVNVKGHIIPTDTVIIPNIFACHHDPNIWEKPFEFYPEHFLSTDGSGELKYTSREELIMFGMGKRQCLGEPLSRIELFIFFISVMQRFQVGMVKKMAHFDVFSGDPGIIRKPFTEEFTFKAR